MSAWDTFQIAWPIAAWVLLSFLVGIPLCWLVWRVVDWYDWNGGVCRENGLPWRRTPYAIGSREYQAGDQYCHMRSPVDRCEVILELIVVKEEKSC